MLKKTLLFVLVALLLLVCVLFIKTYTTESKQLKTSGERKSFSIRYDAIQHLQSAIQIPTVSFDGHINTDTAGFLALHRLFDSVYPLTLQRLEKTVVNSFSLIYRWKGKSSSAKPSILYAHLDVVPIESVNKSEWTHAPFSGDTAEGMVWGRGTLR
jgi:carboxypeptidase PM20D1